MKTRRLKFYFNKLKFVFLGDKRARINYNTFKAFSSSFDDPALNTILNLSDERLIKLLFQLAQKSKSQLKQDLFVLCQLNFKRDGFFVEFGATNGLDLSNTYLLEKDFGWKGILAEPAKSWHQDLRKNRTSHIETDCVWHTSHLNLTFNELNRAEFSTIDGYTSAHDEWKDTKSKGTSYSVNTISLIDLLKKYNAPRIIDYLSIDTEGSEYDILKDFDFNTYQFNIIT